MKRYDVIIVGGGAAGFFTAINAAQLHPGLSVLLLEKGNQFLGKVKVSGGGRCNVTHACFDPNELIKFYPRGSKELRGPFHSFQPGDVFEWFQSRGVELKIEDDNRVFPVTDSSQTIIDCFLNEAKKNGVTLQLQTGVESFVCEGDSWILKTNRGEFSASKLVVATGSSPQVWKSLEQLEIAVVRPVPSLFTFNCTDPLIKDLQGISLPQVDVLIAKGKLEASGPFLITHWGFSGPAILRLSAWGARFLEQEGYNFDLQLNLLPQFDESDTITELKELRLSESKKKIGTYARFALPAKLWQSLVQKHNLSEKNWADLNNRDIELLAESIHRLVVKIRGKSTFKEEFVTSGGVRLKDIDFKTMEHKMVSNLYFAGEVLDIDAITGGFNFQAAWTTGYIAASSLK
ncbi:MAG: NAD(P)/FAD-dependent oxidoreductase [Bacteroidota bacterium]